MLVLEQGSHVTVPYCHACVRARLPLVSFPDPQYGTHTRENEPIKLLPPKFQSAQQMFYYFVTRPSSLLTGGGGLAEGQRTRLGSHDASQMHEYNMYLLRLESYESPALNGSLKWCFEH